MGGVIGHCTRDLASSYFVGNSFFFDFSHIAHIFAKHPPK